LYKISNQKNLEGGFPVKDLKFPDEMGLIVITCVQANGGQVFFYIRFVYQVPKPHNIRVKLWRRV